MEALENPQTHGDNAFVKHCSNYHQGEEEEVQYSLELVGHFSKPVERLLCEGVYIHSDPSDLVMNDKLDHHLPTVARVTYTNAAADRGEGGRRPPPLFVQFFLEQVDRYLPDVVGPSYFQDVSSRHPSWLRKRHCR